MSYQKKQGFTLIELLVVVLIIGILAAVALPQYQKIVEKARAISMLAYIRGISEAQHIYYMEHGDIAHRFEQLDITLPADTQIVDSRAYYQVAIFPYFKLLKNVLALWAKFFYTTPMIYFAHRGANTQRVQNTLSAFALAHQQGARNFELDVHLLKDGTLAVHHDYSLLNTAGADVLLKNLTAADLQKYPLHNPFGTFREYIPLLAEVLLLILPDLQLLNIELKNDDNRYPGIEEILLRTLPPALLPRVLFSSFDVPTLRRLRALLPTTRIGLLTRNFNEEEPLSLGAESVHINHIRFTPQLAQICHRHHWKVYCYTVNSVAQAQQLQAQGADGIFTDDTTLFLAR